MNNEQIDFTLNGTSVGSANTDSSGVATLTNASLSGISAGTHTGYVSASFAGDSTYAGSGPTSGDLTVDKADPNCSVTGYTVTYDGNSHTATGSCSGVGGSTDVLSGLDLSGTTHTNAGTYNGDAWTFTDTTGNYNNDSGTVNDQINKANPTCSVTPYTVTYDGNSHTATGSCTGVGGSTDVLSGLDLSGTTHTNAGTYNGDAWTFTDTTGNYNNDSGTVNDQIDKADPNCSVTGYTVVFDHLSHTATGSCTGVGGSTDVLSGLDLSGTTHTNPGTYTDSWTFTDTTGNYNGDSGTVTDKITYATSGLCDGEAGHAILQPINADNSSVFKQGSTVPAKFRVCDASGNSVGTAGVVSSFRLLKKVSGLDTQTLDTDAISTTPDTAFRWDSTAQQWIFNISTKSLTKNYTYYYEIALNDGSVIDFQFGLK